MEREKKITIKPFLNKSLKNAQLEQSGSRNFPIYLLITYDRKVTKMPAMDSWYYPENQEDKLLNDKAVKEQIHRVKTIIRYEISNTNDYQITGLGKRMKVYFSRLSGVVEYAVGAHLRGKGFEVQGMVSRTPYSERLAAGILYKTPDHKTSKELYYMSQFIEGLFPAMNVYDWLFTDERERLISAIDTYYYPTDNNDRTEYSVRLPGDKLVEVTTAQLVETLDKIVYFSTKNELTLFSDLQIVMLELNPSERLIIQKL